MKSCGKLGLTKKGTQLHAMVAAKKDSLKSNPFVRSALVDMYAKCNNLQEAREILDTLLIRDVVTWNTLITGYVQHGHGKEALLVLTGCAEMVCIQMLLHLHAF